MLTYKILKDKSDIQKTLQIYIPIIQDLNKNINISYREMILQLKINFNHNVNFEDIKLYFETYETTDLKQQIKNLGIQY
jgi:hypothetical protein